MQLTLLIAPTGSGKSSFVADALAKQADLAHIHRDGLAKSLIREAGIDPNLSQTPEQVKVTNLLLKKHLDEAYFEVLTQYLSARGKDVIVDYYPSRDMTWAEQTIKQAKAAGWHINLVGIYADPELTWRRSIERNCRGVDLSSLSPQILEPNGPYFKAWLNTYKIYPSIFSYLASFSVDEVFLWSNNTSFKKLAVWRFDGFYWRPEIFDQDIYLEFRKLESLEIDKAQFTARCVSSGKVGGIWNHVFDVSIQW